MKNNIIKISKNKINNEEINSVDARELWEWLESKQRYADWIKNRIKKYGFKENEDYTIHKIMTTLTQQIENIDYIITVDMAKELSMVEKNKKGRQARKYFIDCEKEIKNKQKTLTPAELILQQAQQLVNIERKQLEMEEKIDRIEKITTNKPGYVSIKGYCNLNGMIEPVNVMKKYGIKSTRYCKKQNIKIGKVKDEKWGFVNTYPEQVIELVIAGYYEQF